jgi:hypothetical protein
VKDVCVARGVRDSGPEGEVWGRGWMPRAWAAGVCVRKAKGASPCEVPFVAFAGEVEDRGSRFGAALGCKRDRNLAICASLRFFSTTSAALSFCVSMSLRRSV